MSATMTARSAHMGRSRRVGPMSKYSAFGVPSARSGVSAWLASSSPSVLLSSRLYRKASYSERVLVDYDHRLGDKVLGHLAEVGKNDFGLLRGPASDEPADKDD